MPRFTASITAVFFTDNTTWLEEEDEMSDRRVLSPEDELAHLEEMLDKGEITNEEAITYLKDKYS